MNTPEGKDREFKLREAELQAKERELRLREIETEIYQDRQAEVDPNSPEPPLSRTTKHNPSESSIQKLTKKIVKFAKFGGFVIVGIGLIKLGVTVGIWLTYFVIASLVAAVGYQIFLKGDN